MAVKVPHYQLSWNGVQNTIQAWRLHLRHVVRHFGVYFRAHDATLACRKKGIGDAGTFSTKAEVNAIWRQQKPELLPRAVRTNVTFSSVAQEKCDISFLGRATSTQGARQHCLKINLFPAQRAQMELASDVVINAQLQTCSATSKAKSNYSVLAAKVQVFP